MGFFVIALQCDFILVLLTQCTCVMTVGDTSHVQLKCQKAIGQGTYERTVPK